ncbi:hypothetical protein B0T22DRAFT_446110 [Podospora appendiculata]|uniref:Uncharacterized protein n=1 Tax=Podospora appendiculata TaxID=314037 RepID=A0AAE1CF12_9PEZI|nr:hypothetical protein B0T22DRAFT_446110 [Podospora appendiculata]
MHSVKTYFLVPGWDYPAGTVLLGSVITNPTQPQLALFRPSVDDIDTPIHGKDRAHFSASSIKPETSADKSAGLFGTFLNVFGLGQEASFHYDRKTVLSYSFRHLHSRWFDPSDALKHKAVIGTDRVAQFCRASDYKASVYMITGVKTIRGAGVTTASGKGTGWRVALSVGADESNPDALPITFAFELAELRLTPDGTILSAAERTAGPHNLALQAKLDNEFGVATFAIVDGFDEEDGTPCRIVASSPACVDLLTAGSAKIDPLSLRRQSRGAITY